MQESSSNKRKRDEQDTDIRSTKQIKVDDINTDLKKSDLLVQQRIETERQQDIERISTLIDLLPQTNVSEMKTKLNTKGLSHQEWHALCLNFKSMPVDKQRHFLLELTTALPSLPQTTDQPICTDATDCQALSQDKQKLLNIDTKTETNLQKLLDKSWFLHRRSFPSFVFVNRLFPRFEDANNLIYSFFCNEQVAASFRAATDTNLVFKHLVILREIMKKIMWHLAMSDTKNAIITTLFPLMLNWFKQPNGEMSDLLKHDEIVYLLCANFQYAIACAWPQYFTKETLREWLSALVTLFKNYSLKLINTNNDTTNDNNNENDDEVNVNNNILLTRLQWKALMSLSKSFYRVIHCYAIQSDTDLDGSDMDEEIYPSSFRATGTDTLVVINEFVTTLAELHVHFLARKVAERDFVSQFDYPSLTKTVRHKDKETFSCLLDFLNIHGWNMRYKLSIHTRQKLIEVLFEILKPTEHNINRTEDIKVLINENPIEYNYRSTIREMLKDVLDRSRNAANKETREIVKQFLKSKVAAVHSYFAATSECASTLTSLDIAKELDALFVFFADLYKSFTLEERLFLRRNSRIAARSKSRLLASEKGKEKEDEDDNDNDNDNNKNKKSNAISDTEDTTDDEYKHIDSTDDESMGMSTDDESIYGEDSANENQEDSSTSTSTLTPTTLISREFIEDFVSVLVIPSLSNLNFPFLQATACACFPEFTSLRWESFDRFFEGIRTLLTCISADKLIVRVNALCGVGQLVNRVASQPTIPKLVKSTLNDILIPNLPKILNEIFRILDINDFDSIVMVLTRIITRLPGSHLGPYLVKIFELLTTQFMRRFNKEIENELEKIQPKLLSSSDSSSGSSSSSNTSVGSSTGSSSTGSSSTSTPLLIRRQSSTSLSNNTTATLTFTTIPPNSNSDDDGTEEAAVTALELLNTMQTILSTCIKKHKMYYLYSQFEDKLLALVSSILEYSKEFMAHEYLDSVLRVTEYLLELSFVSNNNKLSPKVFDILKKFVVVLGPTNDYIDEMWKPVATLMCSASKELTDNTAYQPTLASILSALNAHFAKTMHNQPSDDTMVYLNEESFIGPVLTQIVCLTWKANESAIIDAWAERLVREHLAPLVIREMNDFSHTDTVEGELRAMAHASAIVNLMHFFLFGPSVTLSAIRSAIHDSRIIDSNAPDIDTQVETMLNTFLRYISYHFSTVTRLEHGEVDLGIYDEPDSPQPIITQEKTIRLAIFQLIKEISNKENLDTVKSLLITSLISKFSLHARRVAAGLTDDDDNDNNPFPNNSHPVGDHSSIETSSMITMDESSSVGSSVPDLFPNDDFNGVEWDADLESEFELTLFFNDTNKEYSNVDDLHEFMQWIRAFMVGKGNWWQAEVVAKLSQADQRFLTTQLNKPT